MKNPKIELKPFDYFQKALGALNNNISWVMQSFELKASKTLFNLLINDIAVCNDLIAAATRQSNQ